MTDKENVPGKKPWKKHVVSLDSLVPQDHIVRKLDAALDFSFIYDEVGKTYGPDDMPDIDPVMIARYMLVGYLFGITPASRVSEAVQTDMAYRWFLRIGLTESVPTHDMVVQARQELGGDAVWAQYMQRILRQCAEHNLPTSPGNVRNYY